MLMGMVFSHFDINCNDVKMAFFVVSSFMADRFMPKRLV